MLIVPTSNSILQMEPVSISTTIIAEIFLGITKNKMSKYAASAENSSRASDTILGHTKQRADVVIRVTPT